MGDTPMLRLTPLGLTLRLLLPTDQFLLPLRLTRLSSNPTPPVLLPHLLAELNLITVSSPSDTEPKVELTTSLSRTPGVPHGEIKDTSRSVLTTSAVSSPNHLSQLSEMTSI